MAIKITKHLVVVVLIATTLGLKAQKDLISDENLKSLFKPQVEKILEQYQQFSQFTTDGEKIDTAYYNRFIKLFVPTNSTIVYNDLKFSGSTAEDYYSPSEYARFVKINYSYGLDVTLDITNIDIIDVQEKKGNYTIIVQLNKKLGGLYRTEKIYKTIIPLYFTFTTTTTMGHINPLKIGRISNEYGYQKLYAGSKMKGLYLGISSGLGNTKLENNYSNWQPKAQNNLLKGFEISVFFTRGFGIGTGIFLNNYSTNYEFESFVELEQVADPDGDYYVPQLTTNKLVETDKVKSLDIPILLKFRTGQAKTGLYLDLGIIYSKFSQASYALSGELIRKGYYEQWGVTLENIPVDGYNFQTFSYPSDQNANSKELKIPGNGISAYTALGLSVPISKGMFLKFGANYTLGLTELPASYSNHWVLTEDKYPVKIKSLGFEIGLSYKLTNR